MKCPRDNLKKKAMTMRKWTVFLALFTMIAFSPAADAAFVESVIQTRNDGSILLWLDADYAASSGYDPNGKLTWTDANAWIGFLNAENFLGFDDWRLPRARPIDPPGYNISGLPDVGYDITSPRNDLSYLFYTELGNSSGSGPHEYGPFTVPTETAYWMASELKGMQAFIFNMADGYSGVVSIEQNTPLHYAWAVRDIQTVPVPVVGSLWLLLSGLTGFMFARKRLRKP
jgi:hypothetical protein